ILFEHNGYEVFTSLNVNDALDIVNNEKIELVLTDINMPGKSGFQFISELKEGEETHGIPVLVISSYDSKDIIARAMELGAVGFMRKPFLQYHLKLVTDIIGNKD
ncbi:MAG: response regulator, partial [Chlorobi bacterium]|nr:response regulator [Chlorobiota bacterium]